MIHPPEPGDELLDANLRRAGEVIRLPEGPTPEQLARWKQPAAGGSRESPSPSLSLVVDEKPRTVSARPTPPLKQGVSWMKKPGFWTSLGIAAALLAAVALIPVSRNGQAVAAATIMDSLRDSSHRGLKLEVSRLQTQDVTVDARVELVFPEPVSLSRLLEHPGDGFTQPQSAYVEANVSFSPEAEELAGMQVEAAGSYAEGNQWVFVKLNNLAAVLDEKDAEEGALIRSFGPMLQNGVLLDLEGMDSLLEQGNFDWHGDDDESEDEGAQPANAVRVDIDLRTQVEQAAEVAPDNPSVSWNAGIHLQTGQSEAPANEPELEVRSNEQLHEEFMRGLMTGSMGREQLEELVTHLEQVAQDVSVTEVAPRTWALRAGKFNHEAHDAAFNEIMAQAELVVTYREGVGVEILEINHLGLADGRLTFEFIDELDPGLLNRQRYLDRGIATFDLGAIAQTFAPVIYGAQHGDDSGPTEESTVR